jgi:Zn ribbon nucleic-acid-binding protein
MQHEHHDEDGDGNRECAQCGHAKRFHDSAHEAGIPQGRQKTVCSSPEDGQACTCQGFAPV